MLSCFSPRRLTSVLRRQARCRDGCSSPVGRVHMRCGAVCNVCVLGFLLARRRGGPSLCDMFIPPLALWLSNVTGQICAFGPLHLHMRYVPVPWISMLNHRRPRYGYYTSCFQIGLGLHYSSLHS